MEGVVDRFEGKIAIIELEGEFFMEIPRKFLPKNTKEGDVLEITFKINKELKEKKISKIQELQKKLLNKK